MQLKYILSLVALQAAASMAMAQNMPELTHTAPSGSVTSAPLPAEVYTGAGANSVTTFIPMVPVTDALSVGAGNPSVIRQQTVFTDGFNRPFQSVSMNAFTFNGQARHLVQLSDNGTRRDRYSFLPYSTTTGGLQANAFAGQQAFYSSLYPDEGYTSFSKSVNTSDANSRTLTSYAPGKSQVGQSRGIVSRVITNAANEIRYWDIDAGTGLPVSGGYYAANELFGTETTLPASSTQEAQNAPQTRTYTDKEGRVVVKMVADGSYPAGPQTRINTWLYTYYVYDDKGNLACTIPPKAYAYFASNGNLPLDVANNLCFRNLYDSKGRLKATRKPGEEEFTWAVYDRKNRLVMRQTPKEANDDEWEIIFYDALDRVKATSVYGGSGLKATSFQQWLDDGVTTTNTTDLLYYLGTDAGEAAYPYSSSPFELNSLIAGNTMMSYTWYDKYDVVDFAPYWNDYASQLQFTELLSVNGAEDPQRSSRVKGLPVASMARVLRSPNALSEVLGDWRVNLIYYDDKGRSIYTVSFTDEEYLGKGRFNFDYTGNQYDFAGRLLTTKHKTANHMPDFNGNSVSHTELTSYDYDAGSGNLLKVQHKVDNGAWYTLSKLTYDELGRVKRKDMGNGAEVQDLTYTLRGQLAGINGIFAETGNKGGYSKTFGESLKYDYGFTYPRYDGKIAGMVWRDASGLAMFAYGYNYTQNLSLQQADFRYLAGGAGWDNIDLDYTVSGITYDKNGNILTMKQRGDKPGTGPVDMDDLTYGYEANSNRLAGVTDNGEAYYGAGDFNDDYTDGDDYAYDANGNLSQDRNKHISAFTYTRFNKPVQITREDGSSVEYSYDAAGNKIQEILVNTGSGSYKRTDYLGNSVYEHTDPQNGDKDGLQYLLTGEGRTVYKPGESNPFKEEFFVKDHLGNVRTTISGTPFSARAYLATYELASAHLESLVFDNLDNIRDGKPGGSGDDKMAANLNGADALRRVGSSLLVHVMAGDKVSMNVNTYFAGYNPDDDDEVPGNEMFASLVSTLTGGLNGFPGEGHDVKYVTDAFSLPNQAVLSDLFNSQPADPNLPKAYLNYALFDEHMRVVSTLTGAFQANGNGSWSEIGTTEALEVPENGYLAVWLSNSSRLISCNVCGDVFFDRMNFKIVKGKLMEENHYYPFGLPMQGLSSVSPAGDYKANRHKYQGNELTTELGLHLMDFQARQYDPQLGRFLSPDRLAGFGGQELFSPYAAMGNTPECNVDPNGLMPADKSLMAPMTNTWVSIQTSDVLGGASAASGQANDYLLGTPASGSNPGFDNGGFAKGAITLTDQSQIQAVLNMLSQGANVSQVANNFDDPSGSTAISSSATADGGVELLFEGTPKKKSALSRMWSGIKGGVNRFGNWLGNKLEAADAWMDNFMGHEDEVIRDKTKDDGGGFRLVGKTNNTVSSSRTATNGEAQAVHVDEMGFMFAHGGSGGLGNFSHFYESVSNFRSAFDLAVDVKERIWGSSSTPASQVKDEGDIRQYVKFIPDDAKGHIQTDSFGRNLDPEAVDRRWRELHDSAWGR